MADISKLSRLVGGIQRQVDLSTNTLVVNVLKVGGGAGTDLTKTILDNLINLQNGSDFATGTNAHTHDGRYFTETELSAATGTTGSERIGDDDTYTNITPTEATVKGALQGIDSALAATADEKVSVSSGDTTPGYLDEKVSVDNGTNATNALEATVQSPGGDETFRIRLDQSKIDHGALAGLADDDHTQYIRHDGTRAFSGDQSFGGFKATNLADPVGGQDAVTLAYMNARLNGLTPKAPVVAASTADIDLGTAADPNPIDGVTLANNDRVLLKNQTAPEENGIYIAVDAEDPTTWVRSPDMDSLTPIDEINGAWVAVREGGQAGQVFVQYGTVATLGTDPINFAYFNPIAGLIGGDMITFSGSTFSVDLAAISGLESTNPGNVAGQLRIKLEASNPSLRFTGSNELAAKLDAAGAIASGASGLAVQTDNSSIEINSNALRVKAAGITENHLAASVAGAGLSGGAGSALAVNVDDSTIEINSDTLRVKAAGIQASHINTNVADQSTITGGAGSALAVQHAPKIQEAKVAGEAFAATTLFAVRYAKAADAGFVAGRMYKAAIDASAADNFYVIGLTRPAALLAAGDPMTVVKHGTINVPSHGFTVGAPLFLGAAGAVTATAPTGTDEAIVRVGMVIDANNIDVQIQVMGVN